MKRVLEFIRSVIPEDPWQLLYLAGAVSLFLSPRLAWYFGHLSQYRLAVLALGPLAIAGIVAYYGCFRPGAHPLRRLALAVFLPALLSIGLIIGESTVFNDEERSIFNHGGGFAAFLNECHAAFKTHPTGLSFAVIALAMLGVFGLRLYLGISSLPLRLGGRLQSEDETTVSWDRVQMLVFVLVCPLFLLHQFLGILFYIPSWWFRSSGAELGVLAILEDAVTPAALVLVAILILGGAGKESARSSVRLPEPRFAFLGLLLPVLIGFMISALQYGYDRVNWAQNDFGRVLPPDFTSYFSWTGSWRWTLVVMVFAAFAEEIVFRGMLLKPLLLRYGLHRGIFFTGLIWAAFHFHGEMHQRYSITQALLQLASRIAICVAMNHVLSWMTLRWNSVIPAGIAHTISNVLVVGGINGTVAYQHEMRIALWAICAILLFRYWPIPTGRNEEAARPVANPEPAV